MTVNSVTTAEYGASKAARPFNSRLDKSKLTANGFTPLPTWQDALGRYLKELEFLKKSGKTLKSLVFCRIFYSSLCSFLLLRCLPYAASHDQKYSHNISHQ